MILEDMHVHTKYCDGKNSPEEIVISTINKGIKKIGILVHSYTFFDTTYCVKEEEISKFLHEINNLKSKYLDKIEILCAWIDLVN